MANANGEVEGSPYKIQTYVFLDLETLSFYDDKQRILELSMIAVSREHFRSMKDQARINNPSYKKGDPLPLPRVCHKYTTLYYPKKTIYPSIEEVTGLSNYNLHHLKGFDKNNAISIKQFLKLPPPVAFVAHNGSSFDFPILKAELMGVQEENLESVVCIDSLIYIRHFEKEDIKKLTEIAQEFLDEDDDLINNYGDAPDNCRILENGVNGHSSLKPERIEDVPSCSRDTVTHDNQLQYNFHSPEKLKTKDTGTLKTGNSQSPQKKIKVDNSQQLASFQTPPKNIKEQFSVTPPPLRKNGLPPPMKFTPPLKRSDNANIHTDSGNHARKVLFQSTLPPIPFPDLKHKPQSQPHIYYRIYGKKYFAHRAEADAEALLQICAYHGDDFISWADSNFTAFRNVEPKWHTKRTFVIE